MSTEPSGTRVAARVRDDDLLDALDDAVEEHGSKSEAMRHALRTAFIGDESDSDRDSDEVMSAALAGLPPTAQSGYKTLREATGDDQMVEVGAAKAMVASETNVPSDSVRSMVLSPLKKAGLIAVTPHIRAVFVTVHPPTAALDDEVSR
ncbi:hypothetical protein [Halorubrum sp. CBA1229]|uniref:hypothetical protein n=1 Tax=Halorubrum sp. CBA1229 TaxID=1853699 RepID=UPI0011CD9F66|nr:hypothetical protein [Halorubrum sp. CBA1229]QKY16421.1 hypothetical protein Hrr1229_005835 [Halorubrum sp. CBA1229]